MAYLSEAQLQNLHKYKYSGVDKSLVSKYILQPYWTRLVKLFPLWMAPNLITLLGFSCVVFNMLLVLYYDHDLSGQCPNWVYYSAALGIWIYQSFDAIDGKQARRTGTSGPLGELFDHGCDALNTSVGTIIVTEALQLRQSWWTVISIFTALANFYLSTWEEYHTGTLYLSYFSGPVEGVLILIASLLLTGYAGPSVWLQSYKQLLGLGELLPDGLVPDMQLNHLTIISQLFGAIAGLAPFGALSVVAYAWLRTSPELLTRHLIAFILYIGATFGIMVGRIILAHVVKSAFPYFHITYVPLLFGAVNALLPRLNIPPIVPFVHETAYLHASLALVGAAYVYFCMTVIRDICRYLDINCLSIKQKTGKKDH
ncbi:CDP-alcohol phosphatidyltransferase-domain-containing protein [Syncephalis pseudoplumigaleata]|uniref:diacylglycerol cholinephosphotransferase n=1 Tax=Syncephalis pseudoplumigaleata TaxID=1712513 RepID=A0A4P9YSR5_9FUNG|nr:CDP-alcohol phosphatidyltransferase-domain-containing protein [Syncephalis pseudoplumigaleata]|eukprot:RKP22804.1 CDP-alcohol phosphatidyltransferase-domain-containing protein [Syncephalis pseudoplumigaleata]